MTTGAWLAEGFGTGCAGITGVPRLAGAGTATLGDATFSLELDRARAGASTGLLAAALGDRLRLPGGCTLLLEAPFAAGTAVTDGGGQARYALPIADDVALLGLELRLQALVVDPGGDLGGTLALTNGVHVMVGR